MLRLPRSWRTFAFPCGWEAHCYASPFPPNRLGRPAGRPFFGRGSVMHCRLGSQVPCDAAGAVERFGLRCCDSATCPHGSVAPAMGRPPFWLQLERRCEALADWLELCYREVVEKLAAFE